jgi:aryl-alcohol dehydrogenase-like predicted oxidoreductase
MEKRKLGRTGPEVAVLGYGAMELRHVTERDAERLLNAVLDGGINYIDTSPDYGLSETYIGKAISHRRSEFQLATKCGCNIDAAGKWLEPRHIWNERQIRGNLENSLRLLKTDHVDVWQLHSLSPSDLAGGKNDDVIKTMVDMKQEGKVRSIGVSFRNGKLSDSLYPAGHGFTCAPEFMKWDVFDVMQIIYNGLTRTNELIITRAADQGMGMIVRGVVHKYRDNYPELFIKAKLGELCGPQEEGDDFLIRFALTHPDISTIIIGTKNPDHLARNLRTAERGVLPAHIYNEAKNRLAAIGIAPGQ